MSGRFALLALPFVDIYIAREKARLGDIDGAIELAQTVVDGMFDSGGSILIAVATSVLAEALLQRGGQGDFEDAQAAINRLAAVPTDPGFVLDEITLLRLARTASPGYTATRQAIATIGIATARWRHRLASRGTWQWAEAMP